jgi:hypothetical protein
MKLYKYLSINKNTLESFVNEYVWYSNPASFNDPFDCALISSNILKEVIRKTKMVHCLSASHQNLLMWSHYADSHKGICVEYTGYTDNEIDELLTERPEEISQDMLCIVNNAKKVVYKSKEGIDSYLASLPTTEQEMYSVLAQAPKRISDDVLGRVVDGLLIKHKSWSYEEEYRIIATKNKNSNNKVHPPGKITKIYFGANMSALDKRTIATLLDEICELISMDFASNQYGLQERPFDPNVDLNNW